MSSTPIVNALTIDFEDWYQGLEIPLGSWNGFEDRIEPAARKLLAILAQAEVRATFFVLGHLAERHPDLIRNIAGAGHEIATHGWSHAFVYLQTPKQFLEELHRSIEVLQELSGAPVIGHRAAYFSITRHSLWAVKTLCELGIRYDSSIQPVLNYRYGIGNAPRWPYEITAGKHALTEFPLSTWRLLGHNLAVAGGAYFRIYPYAFTRHAFEAINREGHPAVFYLHPWELDPDHPRIPLRRRIAIPHYTNLRSTEPKLRRLLRDFPFAPMKDVLGVQ